MVTVIEKGKDVATVLQEDEYFKLSADELRQALNANSNFVLVRRFDGTLAVINSVDPDIGFAVTI